MSAPSLRALLPLRILSTTPAVHGQRYTIRRGVASAVSVQSGTRHTPNRPVVTASDFKTLVDNHPATLEFRKRQSVIRTRSAFAPEQGQHNFTRTTLAGEDMIHPTPYVFTDVAAGSLLAFYHLGRKLAGHDGIVHGGVSATLLDECMYKACLSRPGVQGQVAVTANLNVNYKSPIPVETTVLLRAETTRAEGRKAWITATIEDVGSQQVFVMAEALFIQPKWASSAE